jgi:hypothetical protein
MKLLNFNTPCFRGLSNIKIEPLGHNVNIYGENGSGKTTIEDAFLWLLFGKDSADKKDFDLIPHKLGIIPPEPNIGQGKEPVAEAMLEYFGKIVKLKKSYIEEWPKKGELKGRYAGSTTHYYVDDLEVKAGEYQSVVSELVDMKLFKLLTNPRYFSETLSWQERRETLVKIIGDLSAPIDPELSRMMADRPFDKFHALAKQNVKERQKQLDGLPYAISEARRLIPAVLPELPDIDALTTQKTYLENQLQTLKNDDAANAAYREIAQVETEIAEARAKYTAAVDAENAKIRAGVDKLEREQRDKENEKFRAESEITRLNFDINRLSAEKSRKLTEYHDVYDRQWTGSDTCPTCGQPMPPEQIENAKATFNLQRSEDLERFKSEGVALKAEIEGCQAALVTTQTAFAALSDEISVLIGRIRDGCEMIKISLFDAGELGQKLDRLKAELSNGSDANKLAQTLDLEFKIAAMQDQINSAQRLKIQIEQKAEQEKRVAELMAQEKSLNSELGKCEKAVNLCEKHVKNLAKALETAINGKFKIARFRLFQVQKNGEEAECCDVVYPNGSTNLSTGERMQTGIDIINTLSEYYGVDAPIWIDNAEGITLPVESRAQLINLIVSEKDEKLRIEVL